MNAPFWRENTCSPLQHFSILIGHVLEVWRIHQDDWSQNVIVANIFNAFRSQSPLEAWWVRIPLLTVRLALTCVCWVISCNYKCERSLWCVVFVQSCAVCTSSGSGNQPRVFSLYVSPLFILKIYNFYFILRHFCISLFIHTHLSKNKTHISSVHVYCTSVTLQIICCIRAKRNIISAIT